MKAFISAIALCFLAAGVAQAGSKLGSGTDGRSGNVGVQGIGSKPGGVGDGKAGVQGSKPGVISGDV